MSFVSAVPFGDTLRYWWRMLDGDPHRLGFMFAKVIEVSAFLNNYVENRGLAAPARRRHVAPSRPRTVLPPHPSVAVVVPVLCRNASEFNMLSALISALQGQTKTCRPIIVDDGSPVPVEDLPVDVIRLPRNRGPAAARNRGIHCALEWGADVVALTDADCIPAEDWVESLLAAFDEQPSVHAMAGMTMAQDRCRLGRYHERNGTLNGRRFRDRDLLLYGPTCNFAVTEELARAIQFDETFAIAAAEDIDFCYRAHLAGWQIGYASRAIVWHNFGYVGQKTTAQFYRFWRQFRRYAAGERLLLRKHPEYYHALAYTVEIPSARSVGRQ